MAFLISLSELQERAPTNIASRTATRSTSSGCKLLATASPAPMKTFSEHAVVEKGLVVSTNHYQTAEIKAVELPKAESSRKKRIIPHHLACANAFSKTSKASSKVGSSGFRFPRPSLTMFDSTNSLSLKRKNAPGTKAKL